MNRNVGVVPGKLFEIAEYVFSQSHKTCFMVMITSNIIAFLVLKKNWLESNNQTRIVTFIVPSKHSSC